jgi:phage tail-like protein
MAGAVGQRHDPSATFRFRVDVSGLEIGEFSECGGLEMQVKYDEVREGGENNFVHRLPTRVEYGNLTLKRGYVKSNEFYTWCTEVLTEKKVRRRDVSIVLVDPGLPRETSKVIGWTFLNAYPVKWSGPSFKAGENTVAVESLELAHQGLQVP